MYSAAAAGYPTCWLSGVILLRRRPGSIFSAGLMVTPSVYSVRSPAQMLRRRLPTWKAGWLPRTSGLVLSVMSRKFIRFQHPIHCPKIHPTSTRRLELKKTPTHPTSSTIRVCSQTHAHHAWRIMVCLCHHLVPDATEVRDPGFISTWANFHAASSRTDKEPGASLSCAGLARRSSQRSRTFVAGVSQDAVQFQLATLGCPYVT